MRCITMNFLPLILVFMIFGRARSQCTETPTTASGPAAPAAPLCAGQLIFEENFDTFEEGRWIFESINAPNAEFEFYTPECCENTFITDGVLNIKPSLSSRDGISPVTSARIVTSDSFYFKYGRVEIRAKTPTGDWLWPALWMYPKGEVYGGWPLSGELDIVETRGNVNYYNPAGEEIGARFMESTLHWGPNPDWNQSWRTHFSHVNTSTPYNAEFHTFGLDWSPDGITWIIDGESIGSIRPPDGGFWELGELADNWDNNVWASGSKMAPFDQEFFFVMNVAIGGWYFPDDASNPSPKPWSYGSANGLQEFWNARDQWLPTWDLGSNNAALQVDYVRVWAL